jgi:cardiolipin synthase
VARSETAGEPPPGSEEESFLVAVFRDRIWTVPNLLSLARLLCVPLFLWLLFGRDDPAWAAILLGVLGATDWFDGYLARRLGQVSEMGKLLDPAADRILLITAVVAITVYGAVPVWFAAPVMIREPLMFAAVVALGMVGAKRIDVTWFGKAGTFALMVAFPLFLLGAADFDGHEVATALAWVCGIPGLVLSYYATLLYIPMARRALVERARASAS